MSAPVRVEAVDAAAAASLRPRLSEILVACVEAGASVGFLSPLRREEADAYWRKVERAVAEGRCLLLVAAAAGDKAVGTVQLDLDTLPNQRHRATVCKLLVHPAERRRGVGEALMRALEREALDAGRWLLTLDTATGEAERLYRRLGWQLAGSIPCYARNPDGTLAATSYYWKQLAEPGTAPDG